MVDPNDSEYELVDWILYYIASFFYLKFIIIKLVFIFYFKKYVNIFYLFNRYYILLKSY